eukprot:s2451_g3.t1
MLTEQSGGSERSEGGEDGEGSLAACGEQPWLSLESHWDDLSEVRQRELAQNAARCLDMLAAGLELLSDHGNVAPLQAQQAFQAVANVSDIAHFLAAIDVNAMTEQREIALGLFLQGEPNCIQSFVGRRLVIRTFRAVNEGEELCISYAELAEMSKTRHRFLSQQYHFRPELVPQVQERDSVLSAILVPPGWLPAERGVGWSPESGDMGNAAATALVQKAVRSKKGRKTGRAKSAGDNVEMLFLAWRIATSGADFRLGEGHLLRWTLARELMDAFVSTEQWQEALVFARSVSSIGRQIFPQNWPVVSLSLARLAKLELYHGNFANASRCQQPSPSALCWDDRPAIARELQQVLAQANAEARAMPRGNAHFSAQGYTMARVISYAAASDVTRSRALRPMTCVS